MSDTAAGLLQAGLLVVLLGLSYRPFGGFMARVFTTDKDNRIERGTYRVLGVDAKADQTWAVYATSVLAFSLVSVIVLYLLQRLQSHLPLSNGLPNVPSRIRCRTCGSSQDA